MRIFHIWVSKLCSGMGVYIFDIHLFSIGNPLWFTWCLEELCWFQPYKYNQHFKASMYIYNSSIYTCVSMSIRAGGSGPVAPVLARPLILNIFLFFCFSSQLNHWHFVLLVMYNISFMKMCQKLHIWASNFQKFPVGIPYKLVCLRF